MTLTTHQYAVNYSFGCLLPPTSGPCGKGKKGLGGKGKPSTAPPREAPDGHQQPDDVPRKNMSGKGGTAKQNDARFGIPTQKGLDDLFGKRPKEDAKPDKANGEAKASDDQEDDDDEEPEEEGDDQD